MSSCEKFRDGIKHINFIGVHGEHVKRTLLHTTCQYLERIEARADLFEMQREFEVIEPDVGSAVEIFDEDFITGFADNFRNIHHLAFVLSDAPPGIKALQNKLYICILVKLDIPTQEQQIATLPTFSIQSFLLQSMEDYEKAEDSNARAQYQRLVQMGLFELVQRETLAYAPREGASLSLQYNRFLASLNSKIPDVGDSDIIDTFSDYRNSDGRSIEMLLNTVTARFFPSSSDFVYADDVADSLEIKKALLHKLRFGQDDRREYFRKRRENLAQMLFWARNIQDIELFTTSRIADNHFRALVEHRYFEGMHPFKSPGKLTGKYAENPCWQKLARVLSTVKSAPRNLSPDKPTAVRHISKMELVDPNVQMRNLLEDEFAKPVVDTADGKSFAVTFFTLQEMDQLAVRINTIIKQNGGWGNSVGTLLGQLARCTDIKSRILGHSFRGYSLADIDLKLNWSRLPTEVRAAYLEDLEMLREHVNSPGIVTELSDLSLNQGEELQLRKLLELHVFIQRSPEIPAALMGDINRLDKPLQQIAMGEFKAALLTPSLEENITSVYLGIARLRDTERDEILNSIFCKAERLSSSEDERTRKLQDLARILASSDPVPTRIQAVQDLFLAEYKSVQDTLQGSDDFHPRIARDIFLMAHELVFREDRVREGLPILSDAELNDYLTVIKTIRGFLTAMDFYRASFKITHSRSGSQELSIIIDGRVDRIIPIQLPRPLPYSLIKPPNSDDVLFSYGGSRGFVAPFEGIDESYAGDGESKRRFFTHWQLLGLGQYGSVKEVESVFTGLNQVIKKGYVVAASDYSTFQESARQDLRTRLMTTRNDPLSRVESYIAARLAAVEQVFGIGKSQGIRYWQTNDKKRPVGRLFQTEDALEQYHILMDRAKGDTYADSSNRRLNRYSKREKKYHDPTLDYKDAEEASHAFAETLKLAEDLVLKAIWFSNLGFTHNDIKPDNIVYRKQTNGSYDVKFIDWATGGFEQTYEGSNTALGEVFAEVFGSDVKFSTTVATRRRFAAAPRSLELTQELNSTNKSRDIEVATAVDADMLIKDTPVREESCQGDNGRFVRLNPSKTISFGIDPSLEIFHGARNGTVPYISPKALSLRPSSIPRSRTPPVSGRARSLSRGRSGAVLKPQSYKLRAQDTSMDDWALTVMLFGICNRDAYFTFVKGRAVLDYVVPGILERDDFDHFSLKIVNESLFDEYFACGSDQKVIFVPSTQREGEPLHFFRRLLCLRANCCQSGISEIPEAIDLILNRVYRAVHDGIGLSKEELQSILQEINQCFTNYEKLRTPTHPVVFERTNLVDDIIQTYAITEGVSADSLLQKVANDKSQLEALCIYPLKTQQEAAISILDKVMDKHQLQDKCLQIDAPFQMLFLECIAAHQSEILILFMKKMGVDEPSFITLVEGQGLLHYALEQGLTDVAGAMLEALTCAGASFKKISQIILREYDREAGQPHIQWSTNAVHIAIRNRNRDQLELLLTHLLNCPENDDAIHQALYWCATFSDVELYQLIVKRYEAVHAGVSLNAEMILKIIFPPFYLSAYHLFLQDESTLHGIDWKYLAEHKEVAKQFLLTVPTGSGGYPCLIAVEKGNFVGLARLFDLCKTIALSAEEWRELLLQKDIHGKNILNYLLESEKFEQLEVLITTLKENCGAISNDILLSLLDNPHPLNPLENVLKSTIHYKNKYQLMHQVLGELCTTFRFASPKKQESRSQLLLKNYQWLIAEAEDSSHHPDLRELLQNDALTVLFRRDLFARLKAHASLSSTASMFYATLLREITTDVRSGARLFPARGLSCSEPASSDGSIVLSSFKDFFEKFSTAFKNTNSTGILEMQKFMKSLEQDSQLSDIEKYRRTSSEMTTIAQKRTNSPLINMWSTMGFWRGGRSREASKLYTLMKQPTFSLLNDESFQNIAGVCDALLENPLRPRGVCGFFCLG